VKKLLLSALTLLLVIGLVGAGTYAWFQDTETSTGNTFTAGTLDLKIRDFTGLESGQWKDGVTATWGPLTNMIPGVSEAYGIVQLQHLGTVAADHLEITCSYTVDDDPDVESDTDKETYLYPERFARYVEITYLQYKNDTWQIIYNGTSWSTIGTPPYPSGYQADDWEVSDSDGVLGISVADLAADPLDNLPPPYGSLETQFEMRVKFRSDAGNDLQGDEFNLTMIFTLNQHSSQ